jgi:hypothetical protein
MSNPQIMAKRFTDSEIWKSQRWFRKLNPTYKLAFCYIKDQCNHAGIWRIDCSDLTEDLAIDKFDFEDFIKSCNIEYDKITGDVIFKERLKVINNNFLWITGFIQFQYQGKDGKVSPIAAPVRTALEILEGLDKGYARVTEGLGKGYGLLGYAISNNFIILTDYQQLSEIRVTEGLDKGYVTPKDKDKEIITTITKTKTNSEISDDEKIFNDFRELYGGTKNGNPTEFKNFQKKHKDWKEVLPQLPAIIKKQIEHRRRLTLKNEFVPHWKNLSTWINQRCWEQEIPLIANGAADGRINPNGNGYAVDPQAYIFGTPPKGTPIKR